MSSEDLLFERIVELCGFSAYVGPGAVRRSLAETGCDGAAVPEDYERALPALKRRLEVYVDEGEADERMQRIVRFLSSSECARLGGAAAPAEGDDETQWGKRRFGKSVAILQKAREGIEPDGS